MSLIRGRPEIIFRNSVKFHPLDNRRSIVCIAHSACSAFCILLGCLDRLFARTTCLYFLSILLEVILHLEMPILLELYLRLKLPSLLKM
jgi:hypothetical protein